MINGVLAHLQHAQNCNEHVQFHDVTSVFSKTQVFLLHMRTVKSLHFWVKKKNKFSCRLETKIGRNKCFLKKLTYLKAWHQTFNIASCDHSTYPSTRHPSINSITASTAGPTRKSKQCCCAFTCLNYITETNTILAEVKVTWVSCHGMQFSTSNVQALLPSLKHMDTVYNNDMKTTACYSLCILNNALLLAHVFCFFLFRLINANPIIIQLN